MRIGIDARTILNPEHGNTIGSGHYTYHFIRHLLDIDKENEYVLFFDFRVREKDVIKFTRDNVSIRFYPFSDYKKYLPGAYNEILGRAVLSREKLDILHSTSPMSRIPAGYDGKSVTTFHNLGVFAYGELYPRMRRMRERALIRFMAKKSTHSITASRALAEDFSQKFERKAEDISVIHTGVDKRFFQAPETDGSKFREHHGIDSPYVLFLGTLSPINNITRLLEAFAKFSKEHDEYQLVLAGKRDWMTKEFKQMAKDLGIASKVVFTGYVVGDDLVPLFKNAEFFIMPSLYEGFGSTVLESLATGTPTIASRVSSLPEVAGDAVEYIEPHSVDSIAEAMTKFADDEDLRKQYAKKGPDIARKFDWDETARKTLEVYKKLVARSK